MATSDLILLGILLLGIWNGWRMGTIKVIAKLGSYVVGYRAARFFSPYVAAYIGEAFPNIANGAENTKLDALFSLFFDSAGGGFISRLLEMAAFVIVFTIVCWLIRKLAFALTGIFGRGLLGQLNRALGAFVSFLIAIVLIFVLTDVVLPAFVGLGMGTAPMDFFDNSKIVMPLLRNFQTVF